MATSAVLPSSAATPATPAAPAASRPRLAFPTSGTALLLIFTVALILAVVAICAVIASPTWPMLGAALGTNLVLTGAILLTLLRYLED